MTTDNERNFQHALHLIDSRDWKEKTEKKLNRVFRKQLDRYNQRLPAGFPPLTSQNTTVTTEIRAKQDYIQLAQDLDAADAQDGILPIVIVRYQGDDYLVDGHHRCSFWHRNPQKAQDDFMAVVVTVVE